MHEDAYLLTMIDTIEPLLDKIKTLESRILELEFHEKQLELVIASTAVGIWDWQVQTGALAVNERWANIIGYTLEELGEVSIDTWMEHAHSEDLKESNRLLEKHWAGKTEYYIFETRMKHKCGRWVWVYDTGKVIEWESEGVPSRMIGTHLDISDKKEYIAKLDAANKKLMEFSYLDSLTQIPNRRAYEERFLSIVDCAKRSQNIVSLLIIDVDHFKDYNDHYGHEKGDDALFKVAQTIKRVLTRKTDFVARYGGEEIAVLLPFTSLEGAKITAEKIIQRIMDERIEHVYSQHGGILTVSIGVASTSTEFDDLFDHADTALYVAKNNGRNSVEVYSLNNR
jgi:diguanylate cyclase (GGDEF)-like protein/PAS domain S-box-containing protein